MEPTLLLDKLTFQLLSSHEMHRVTNYFHWNRVDILLVEIISDLFKETKTASRRNEASILADKVSVIDSSQNMNYIKLCLANLRGYEVVMDFRLIIAPATISTLDDGHTAAYVDETQFCEMIHRWQRGEFNKKDIEFAKMWKGIKDSSKADKCFSFLQANHIIFPKSTSIDERRIVVDDLLSNSYMKYTFLDMFLSYEGTNHTTKYLIKKRLEQCRYSLPTIAPYAFYCLKVLALFLGAYKFDLLPRKKSDDQIDLE